MRERNVKPVSSRKHLHPVAGFGQRSHCTRLHFQPSPVLQRTGGPWGTLAHVDAARMAAKFRGAVRRDAILNADSMLYELVG